MASLAAAWVVIAGITVLGLVRATGQPQDAGISLAAAGVELAGARTEQSVVVRNGTREPFTGQLTTSTGKQSSAITLRLAPGESRTVVLSTTVRAACRGAVDIRLETPGAPPQAIQLSCPTGPQP